MDSRRNMASVTCFICRNVVREGEDRGRLKEKSLKTFIEASRRRKDGHYTWLQTQKVVVVHEKCRKGVYTKESSIVKAEKEAGERSSMKRCREEVPKFNFKELCLYCGKDASESFKAKQKKLPVHRRETVRMIMTLDETMKKIRDTATARGDESGIAVLHRMANESDLVAAEGRYHNSCRDTFFHSRPSVGPNATQGTSGRRESSEVTKCVDFITQYLENNEDLCQFSLNDILQQYGGPEHRKDYLVQKLSERFGDEVIVVPGTNRHKPITICYKNVGHSILSSNWYETRKQGPDERLRIVETAADIIREDIRSKVYELDKYPSPDNFLNSVDDDIPESLKLLLTTITNPRGKKKNAERIERARKQVKAIAHSLISVTRPRSFTSPILLGIGTLLYRKFGSRHLVDVLSAMGFSSAYGEVRKLEVSTLQQPLDIITKNSFTQFVFDNADINMDTIDGHGTFHAMGGIQCFTPKSSLVPRTPIPKVKSIPPVTSLSECGTIPLEHFDKPRDVGLASLTIQPTPGEAGKQVLPKLTDMLWMFGKWKNVTNLPGWNGFMERITANEDYQTSRVLCLPFIKAPPSDADTVYTSLKAAVEKSADQKHCFVTFDHPLYMKARAIVASCGPDSQLNRVVVRLGGFHLLMSFMGAIGYIMDGSGLQDLFNVCFALASTKTIMSGHYYSRAVRAHILAQLSLSKIVLSSMSLSEQESTALMSILFEYGTDKFQVDEPVAMTLMQKYQFQLNVLEKHSPTAELWVQYFRMVCILKQFIEAERSGDWFLHLESIKNMIPYFHASGHFNYAKGSQIYLQDMLSLRKILTPAEHEQFTTKGFFTIRRSQKHWSGIWSDMTIEQVLMRAISACGGLSRGRGITDGTLARWIAGMPTAVDISHQIEDYCGVSFTTSDQHVDTTNSRMQRDNKDVEKFSQWFESHDPFPRGPSIMCISTGVLGGVEIDCHKAYEKGMKSLDSMRGNDFKGAKFLRKNRVLPLQAVKSKVTMNGESVPISSDTIFRRIPFNMKSPQVLESYFSFELAPYPVALFDEDGMMRKTKKSDLYKLFLPVKVEFSKDSDFIVDGGFLLHRVVWNTGEKFSTVITKYLNYVESNFGSNCFIVFDGYPESSEKSTKSAERARRARTMSSASVMFDESMTATMPKERFLANENNKKRLIAMLTEKFISAHIQVRRAVEDADTLIVATAVERSRNGRKVFIVGEDTDLMVLLTDQILLNSEDQSQLIDNIFLMKPGKGNQQTVIYSPNNGKLSEDAKRHILFLHAFSGCDTTSSFFRQGKVKFINTLAKNPDLLNVVSIFLDLKATPDQVAEAGAKFIVAVYSGIRGQSLNQLRLQIFQRALSKNSFNLASLPPSELAARQHSFRAFLQVQMWRDRRINAEQWGWKSAPDGLIPIQTTQPPAPKELLNSIFCACKKGCKNACSCRKAGLKCSAICAHCKGHACLNSLSEQQDEDDLEQHEITLESSELQSEGSASEDEDDLEAEEGAAVEEEKEQELDSDDDFPEQAGPSKRRRTSYDM